VEGCFHRSTRTSRGSRGESTEATGRWHLTSPTNAEQHRRCSISFARGRAIGATSASVHFGWPCNRRVSAFSSAICDLSIEFSHCNSESYVATSSIIAEFPPYCRSSPAILKFLVAFVRPSLPTSAPQVHRHTHSADGREQVRPRRSLVQRQRRHERRNQRLIAPSITFYFAVANFSHAITTVGLASCSSLAGTN
jgi:hypothetical protein